MIPTPLWVHRFAVVTACLTLLLLCAGALVTGTGSGLAVPDWPLSYGQFFPRMVGGVLYEHGHRMIAGVVGIFMLLLTLAVCWKEKRQWVKVLSLIAFLTVVTQATLGGLTVLYRLPKPISVSHACLAQIFFSLTVVLALVTSPFWNRKVAPLRTSESSWLTLPRLSAITAVGFFLQLLLGATMRHLGAGLAIPDFPTVFGGVIPPIFTPDILVHFAHRMGALVMTLLVTALVVRIFQRHGNQLDLVTFVGVLAAAVAFQIMLGAMVIWLKRPIPVTTAHLALGAVCLASSVALALQVLRRHGGMELA